MSKSKQDGPAGLSASSDRKRKHSPATKNVGGKIVAKTRPSTMIPMGEDDDMVLMLQPILAQEWHTLLGISPPKKKLLIYENGDGDGTENYEFSYMSVMDVERFMKDDSMHHYLKRGDGGATDEQKIVYFLYGAGFLACADKVDRTTRIQAFLEGEPKKRIMDVLVQKDSDATHCADKIEKWRQVQAVVLRYSKQNGAFTVFDNKNMPVVMRTQASSNCYGHATGGVVGYKMCFGKMDNKHKITAVDMSKYMRHTITSEELERRVVFGKGGHSKNLLTQMISDTGLEMDELSRFHLDMAHDILKEKGPALVSRFRTDSMFKNFNKERESGNLKTVDGTYRIHQFDRIDNKDTHAFFELGNATPEERALLEKMEEANRKEAPPEACSSTDEPVVDHIVSMSQSGESIESNSNELVSDNSHGFHAMILIGSREGVEPLSGKKKLWFLVQNTWTGLPLFETSKEYLYHHFAHGNSVKTKGSLVFLHGTFNEPKLSLPVVKRGLFLECEVDDGEDEDEEEEEQNDSDLEG